VEQGYQTAPRASGAHGPAGHRLDTHSLRAYSLGAQACVPTAWVPTALLLPIASLPTSLGARAAAAAPTRHPGADGRGSARTSCVAAVEEP
jgi:hypothetical protein